MNDPRAIRHGLTVKHEGSATIISGLDDTDRPIYVALTCGQVWCLLKGFAPVDRMLEKLEMPDQTGGEPS